MHKNTSIELSIALCIVTIIAIVQTFWILIIKRHSDLIRYERNEYRRRLLNVQTGRTKVTNGVIYSPDGFGYWMSETNFDYTH